MKEFRGRVAAVTGAGSGIGRALSTELARRGCHVAVSDVDEDGLAATVSDIEALGTVSVSAARIDVADRDAMHGWADDVVRAHGGVNVIVNNAGVALTGNVGEMSYDDFHWLMDINFWGVVHGTTAFLPHLRGTGDGHVVNISSVFGLAGIPTQAAYNSAKFGVRGFTEALRIELDLERCGVSATSIHPGGIDTDIVRNARLRDAGGADLSDTERQDRIDAFRSATRTSPDEAALLILRAVERNRRRAMIGKDAMVFDLVTRLSPALAQRVLERTARRNGPLI